MCTALYMMVLHDQARVGPTTKTSDEISIICLFRLILQAYPLFCFELWYSSCFDVNCWLHTFPKWWSHTPLWILILLDHRVCHFNFLSTGVLLFKWIRSFQHPQDQLKLSQRCLFHPSQVAFVFPPSHPFYSRTKIFFLNQISILYVWSLFFLFFQYSYPVILMKILTELLVHHFSFFSRYSIVPECS